MDIVYDLPRQMDIFEIAALCPSPNCALPGKVHFRVHTSTLVGICMLK